MPFFFFGNLLVTAAFEGISAGEWGVGPRHHDFRGRPAEQFGSWTGGAGGWSADGPNDGRGGAGTAGWGLVAGRVVVLA